MRHTWILLLCADFGIAERIAAPRVWADKDLKDWATPVAGLNVRPGHFSEREYYAAPEGDYLRTYPVYFPGREPKGYLQMLRNKGPEPLLRPGPRSKQDWIRDGKVVFHEMDVLPTRSYDPKLIETVLSAEAFGKAGAVPRPDGTVGGLRWVPTSKGLALSVDTCSGCHTRYLDDGRQVDGAPGNSPGNAVLGQLISRAIQHIFGEQGAAWTWRSTVVPWLADDMHAGIRTMSPDALRSVFRRTPPGTFVRFNGSPFYPTKVPDLIGIGDRKYIDHTATHQLRGPGDFMRYAALVGCCDLADFGSHRILTDEHRRILFRYPDEALFALAQYVYSLKPPANPNVRDARSTAGERVFHKQQCGTCHTPPFYTNNKLTLAAGFQPPADHPLAQDMMPVSVGTDPGLALKTRKGTGLYKVPSLRGVWYRGRFGHDGSIGSLEEWFDPARLSRTPGHEFGMRLSETEKAALVAFLKTL